jgi:hypothetical protein
MQEERVQLSKHKRGMAQTLLEINLLRSKRDWLVDIGGGPGLEGEAEYRFSTTYEG